MRDYFSKGKGKKYNRSYYLANRETIAKQVKEYRTRNIEATRARDAIRNALPEVKERNKILKRKKYLSNRESVLSILKEKRNAGRESYNLYMREYRNATPERQREISKKSRGKNKEKLAIGKKKYYSTDKAKKIKSDYQKKYWIENFVRLKKAQQEYFKANRTKFRKYQDAYLSRKREAVPVWADKEAIADVYEEARYMGLQVDHIVPLQSKLVCGLHVWDNLQLLEKSANVVKGNRHWPDMPTN